MLSDRDYLVTTSVTGSLTIDSNAGLTTAGAAFPRLTRVGGYLCIMGNRNLATLGTAFPVLGEFGTHSTGISLFVYNNAALRSLGTAFASLRRIPGTLLFNDNPLLTDWEALRNLTCHGSPYYSSGWVQTLLAV